MYPVHALPGGVGARVQAGLGMALEAEARKLVRGLGYPLLRREIPCIRSSCRERLERVLVYVISGRTSAGPFTRPLRAATNLQVGG